MDNVRLDKWISNSRKHCSADVPAVVATIMAALSMQTTTEQLSAKPTDLVLAKGQESAPH